MHINDLYEQQAKDLLHKLCDALGIADEDRTRAKVEAAIASRNKSRFCVYTGISFSGGGWIDLDLMMLGKPIREISELGVFLNPEDKFLLINGVGEVAIPDGAGVLPVTSSLGISGTLDIKESKELGLRKLVGYQFTQRHSVKGSGE